MAPADQIINVVKRGSRGKEILNIEKNPRYGGIRRRRY